MGSTIKAARLQSLDIKMPEQFDGKDALERSNIEVFGTPLPSNPSNGIVFVTLEYNASGLQDDFHFTSSIKWGYEITPRKEVTTEFLYSLIELTAEHLQSIINETFKRQKSCLSVKFYSFEECKELLEKPYFALLSDS